LPLSLTRPPSPNPEPGPEPDQVDVDGIKVTPYRAGHVLGACMFYLDIGGLRVLYTGRGGTLLHLSPQPEPL